MTLALHEMLLHADSPFFISTWRTTAANETITLPLSGGSGSAYNFNVDWGDGTPTDVITSATDAKRVHHYATPGDHQVKILGTLHGWAFSNLGDRTKIRSVDNWGILRFTQGQTGHFFGCTNLQINATDLPVLSASCGAMFRECISLSVAPSMARWDTSAVKNISEMFNGATAFDQDIGSWNTAAVTLMTRTFENATSFNQDIGRWNTGAVTGMGATFQYASSFNQNIGSWDTSAVTTLNGTFNGATVFNQDIGSWNTAAVTNMTNTFRSAKAFNQNIGGWNTGAATSMASMFMRATAFNCGQPAGVVHTLMQRTATGGWRIGGIGSTNMNAMFLDASSFAGDISSWCADVATTTPTSFAVSAHPNFTVALQPTWGSCPIPD